MVNKDIADLLFTMRSKGVKIWTHNGQLHYQALKGVITPAEIDALRALRAEIISFLDRSAFSFAIEPQLVPRPKSDRIPLTFSQQWFWNGLELEKCHSMRTIASAVRMSGQLSIDHLQKSFTEVVRRHESLRTRLVKFDGVPIQHIDEVHEYELEIIELTRLQKKNREMEAKRLAEELVYEPFFVAEGPLFAARLLKLEEFDHLLIIAMDHIVSDIASLRILWQEIFVMYAQFRTQQPCLLPTTTIQFADFAVWQHKSQQSWMEKHDTYWRERLANAQRVRLFADEETAKATGRKWATLPIQLGGALSVGLRELSRRERTSLAMTVLTVFVALVLRWCNKTDVVVPFTTMGRRHPEVENVIGMFGAPLFLRIETLEDDSFVDLLRRVTNEYDTAYRHDDSCRVAAQLPEPEFVWNPIFNWLPQEADMNTAEYTDGSTADGDIRIVPWRLEVTLRNDINWGAEFRVDLSDTVDGVTGTLGYPADRFTVGAITLFAQSLRLLAEKFVNDPGAGVGSSPNS